MKKIFIYIGLLFLIFPRTAHAYLGPENANYLFQVLAAGGVGVIFFFKDIVRKAKEIFGIKEKTKESSNE